MMQRVAAHQRVFNPHDAGINHLLLAIGRANPSAGGRPRRAAPTVRSTNKFVGAALCGRPSFHPMCVIVVQQDLVSTMDQAAQWGCETPQLLPFATQTVRRDQQRMVQGEILSDEHGRLYEKLGRYIRPVNQLASGSSGELIEMIPAERHNLRVIPSATIEKQQSTPATRDALPKKFVPSQTAENVADNLGHRKLFTDPGQWRVVNWGEFKEILAPQLAHPERLRETYRLPCYVQIVETNRDVTIEELAKEFSTPTGRPKPLYFLTDEVATKLELTSLLPPLPPGAPAGHRAPNLLSAHQRVFRLLVANDPTVDVGNTRKRSDQSTTKPSEATPAPVRKTSIPVAFVKEWEFKISREEALYDMNSSGRFTGLQRVVRKLRLFKKHGEFRKWQVLLGGRNHDEQLWSVRPPANGFEDSFVLEWAKKTLETAGYDINKMLLEWEIFWRRKGQH